MIIPIRCFTCGKILADKYNTYEKMVKDKKLSVKSQHESHEPSVIDMNSDDVKKTPEGEVLDELGIIRYCCRKIFLTHINLIDEI